MEKTELERLLSNQKIISNNSITDLTSILASSVEIIHCEEEKDIVLQGEQSHDIYFILKGEVVISINGRKKAVRKFGEQVGEMAVVNLGAPRAATMTAVKNSVLAKIDEKTFSEIANQHPQLWKNIAQTLACRLLERNVLERPRNSLPKIFLVSSGEGKKEMGLIAEDLKNNQGTDDHFDVNPWNDQGIFAPSSHIMETLEREAKLSDFAIIVLSADDKLDCRKQKWLSPRDNVILELGLFIGAIDRDRVFIVEPESGNSFFKFFGINNKRLKLPTDLDGITRMRYKTSNKEKEESLKKIASEIRKIVLTKKQI
jgi:predicted nucleotide-binding protein